MRSIYERQIAEQREISGQLSTGADKIVPLPNWVWFARRCWGSKVDVQLAVIAGCADRTARRWLTGEFEPPNKVMAALIQKMFERGF